MKRKDFMRSPVKHIDLEKIKTLSELVDAFKHSGEGTGITDAHQLSELEVTG